MAAKASTSNLKIVVVGAGIAGLATALALGRDGHHVHILEAGEKRSELGAGIQIPPNAARILHSWGSIGEEVERMAMIPTEANMRRFSTGQIVGSLRKDSKKVYGYADMTIHRADFQKLLYDHAISHKNVDVTFGAKVTYDDVKDLKSSKFDVIRRADLVVAVDGISSAVRKGLFPSAEHQPRLTGATATRVILPCDKMKDDPRLAELVNGATNNVWMGPKRHVVAYTIRGLDLYNVVLCGPGEAPVGVYNEPYNPAKLREEYSDFDELVGGILDKADTAHRWLISEVGPLPAWSAHGGRLVLLGDAAHAMMPYTAQGAAQGLEDAAVLAICLAHIGRGAKDSDLLEQRVDLYVRLRKPRCERVIEVARSNSLLYGLEDGPEQRRRDERFNRTLKKKGEDQNADEEAGKERGRARPTPDSQAEYGSPEFSEWLYNYDVVKEAEAELRK